MKPFTGPLRTEPLRGFEAAAGTGRDAERAGAGGLMPGFLGADAMVVFPDGLG